MQVTEAINGAFLANAASGRAGSGGGGGSDGDSGRGGSAGSQRISQAGLKKLGGDATVLEFRLEGLDDGGGRYPEAVEHVVRQVSLVRGVSRVQVL